MEDGAMPEYEKSKTWLVKLSDPNQDWNAYAKNNSAQDFIEQHKDDVDMVIKVEQLISQIGGATHKEYVELLAILGNIFFVNF